MKEKRIRKADRLAYLWWNYQRVRPRHQIVPIDAADFAKLEQAIRRFDKVKGERRRRANLVVDLDHLLSGYSIDEYVWAPPLRPSQCCTCPDGSGKSRALHQMRENLHMAALPMSQYGCDPKCPFCGRNGVAYESYRRYDYPYGYTANSGLTILLVPPPSTEARRMVYAPARLLAPYACYDLTAAMTVSVLGALESRVVKGSLSQREMILVALRQSHHNTHINILRERGAVRRGESTLQDSDRLTLDYQDAALHFVIPFWTNVCYFPDRNAPERNECIYPIFTKTIQNGDLVLVGNFAVSHDYYDDWREHLEPLGTVQVSN